MAYSAESVIDNLGMQLGNGISLNYLTDAPKVVNLELRVVTIRSRSPINT